jgi:hypothetical protein
MHWRLTACLTLLAACTHGDPTRTAHAPQDRWRSLLGCYDAGFEQFALDSTILYEQAVTVHRGARSLKPSPEYYRWGWRLRSGDSVEVWTAMIEAGTMRTFSIAGDSLVGTLTFRCEACIGPQSEPIRITAQRIPCPPA